jgi:hypothetical protein
MNNSYAAGLNLNIDPINPEKKIEFDLMLQEFINSKNTYWYAKSIDVEYINIEFIEFLKSLNVELIDRTAYISILPPGKSCNIHIDAVTAPHNDCVLNFVWGSDNHVMNWYKLNDDNYSSKENLIPFYDESTSEGFIVNEDMCTKISEYKLIGPTLIRVGVPHNTTNFHKEKNRFCLIFLIKKLGINDSKTHITNKGQYNRDISHYGGIDFDEALEMFSDYLL